MTKDRVVSRDHARLPLTQHCNTAPAQGYNKMFCVRFMMGIVSGEHGSCFLL